MKKIKDMKFSFDGKGLNRKDMEYCPRVATLNHDSTAFSDEEISMIGRLFECSPDMALTLRHIDREIDLFDRECQGIEHTDTAEAWNLLNLIRHEIGAALQSIEQDL